MSRLGEPERLDQTHSDLARVWQKSAGAEDEALKLMNEKCDDPECSQCAAIACPEHHPFHFHHDGCPACEGYDGGHEPPILMPEAKS